VTRVVKSAAGTEVYESTWFEYAKNGTAVSYVLNESWTWDGVADPAGYQILEAREFRYDGARQRYLNRKLDPAGLQQAMPQYVSLSDTWTDYDGDEPYGDFSVSGSTASNLRSFELGLATVDPWMGSTRIRTKYYHDDHLGTTLTTTDKNATPGPFRVRTAFGEPVAGPADRYGYAGAWGYQSTLHETSGQAVFPFLHVGARYYDPSSGRFLQRDPIGIEGGLNVYQYVDGGPTVAVDPDGFAKVKTPSGRWRDTRTGRFTKAPWWRRATRWTARRVPVYIVGSCVARVGHKIANKPYEDPVDVIMDTVENLIDYGKNSWRDRQKRKKSPGAFGGA